MSSSPLLTKTRWHITNTIQCPINTTGLHKKSRTKEIITSRLFHKVIDF